MMDEKVRSLLADRDSGDREKAYQALQELFAMTESEVPWAYDVWDRMVADLSSSDNHKRSFAGQMLARLAVSDLDGRIFQDLPALVEATKDKRFVTARHVLGALWRVGLAGPDRARAVVDALEARFRECDQEKNGSLLRSDIVASLRRLAEATGDADIEERAHALIESETDEKARKKQRAAWRAAGR